MASGDDQSDFISLHSDGNSSQNQFAAGSAEFSHSGGWRGHRGAAPYRGRGRGNTWRSGGQMPRGQHHAPRGDQWHRGRGGRTQQHFGGDGSSYNEQRESEQWDVSQYYSPAMVQNPWATLERQRTTSMQGAGAADDQTTITPGPQSGRT